MRADCEHIGYDVERPRIPFTTPATTMDYNRPAVVEATFSPRIRAYLFLYGTLVLISTIVGIVLLPLWIPFGLWWSKRSFESLSCTLTDRAVAVRRGVFFRREVTIPLDKIQDISLREGPLLRRMGLVTLRIETAGQNTSSSGMPEADLTGLIEARSFRDRVLHQRDVQPLAAPNHVPDSADVLLKEIRDILWRIERNTTK